MSSDAFLSPAKINLFLAITGRRTDGFHDLVSVVAPLAWGDTLRLQPAAEFSLECDRPEVPVDESNLILKAARWFAEASRCTEGAHFILEKRIPIGAGLGGGSSNAATALRLLNTRAGEPLDSARLMALAARVGSDCPLFLSGQPLTMRGRGERVELLPDAVAKRLRGRRVLVFKPDFGISTPWAYQQMVAAAPRSYLLAEKAENRLAAWVEDDAAPGEALLFNNMEAPAFGKYVALPVLLAQLRREFGLEPRMSGSGSACFALLPETAPASRVDQVIARIQAAWGPSAFVVETRIA